jgi:hypothetical protein
MPARLVPCGTVSRGASPHGTSSRHRRARGDHRTSTASKAHEVSLRVGRSEFGGVRLTVNARFSSYAHARGRWSCHTSTHDRSALLRQAPQWQSVPLGRDSQRVLRRSRCSRRRTRVRRCRQRRSDEEAERSEACARDRRIRASLSSTHVRRSHRLTFGRRARASTRGLDGASTPGYRCIRIRRNRHPYCDG